MLGKFSSIELHPVLGSDHVAQDGFELAMYPLSAA